MSVALERCSLERDPDGQRVVKGRPEPNVSSPEDTKAWPGQRWRKMKLMGELVKGARGGARQERVTRDRNTYLVFGPLHEGGMAHTGKQAGEKTQMRGKKAAATQGARDWP